MKIITIKTFADSGSCTDFDIPGIKKACSIKQAVKKNILFLGSLSWLIKKSKTSGGKQKNKKIIFLLDFMCDIKYNALINNLRRFYYEK